MPPSPAFPRQRLILIPLAAWTQEMASFARSLAPSQLLISGGYIKGGNALSVPELDMVGGSYYEADTAMLKADVAVVGGRVPVLLTEFGLAGNSNATTVASMLSAMNSSAIAGGLYWSLRGHSRDGGFYWHYESILNPSTGEHQTAQPWT